MSYHILFLQNRREGKIELGQKQKLDDPWNSTHYTNTVLTYIGAVSHPVADDAEGYEDYAGRLLHWHVVGGWSETALEVNGKLPAALNVTPTPAYHFDTAKPYIGRHQIDILIDKKPYHIPNGSPREGHIFFKLLRPLKASQVAGSIIKPNNLHNYEYNGNFSGCLCWTRMLIKYLAKENYIDSKAPEQFENVVSNLRKKKADANTTLYDIPVDDGVFFKKQVKSIFVDFAP
jgi:hypothetical protein